MSGPSGFLAVRDVVRASAAARCSVLVVLLGLGVLTGCGAEADDVVPSDSSASAGTSSTSRSTTSSSSRRSSSSTGGDSSDDSDDSEFSSEFTIEVVDITSFDQIDGSSDEDVVDGARDRFRGGEFTFDEDGRFTYDTTASKNPGTYPVRGRYERDGDEITFEGTRTSSTSTATFRHTVEGTLTRDGDTYEVTMKDTATQTMGAVIDDTPIGGSAASEYEVTLECES